MHEISAVGILIFLTAFIVVGWLLVRLLRLLIRVALKDGRRLDKQHGRGDKDEREWDRVVQEDHQAIRRDSDN